MAGATLQKGNAMREDLQLGYVLIDAVDTKHLDSVFVDVLGMFSVPVDEGFAYRMDDWDRRFIVQQADADRLAGIGLVAANERAYDRLVAGLEEAGVALRIGTAEECELRSVRTFVAFVDPAGIPVELGVAPTKARGVTFMSPLVPGGFQTGSQGLGHVVVLADDREATVKFYTDHLDFKVSDTVEEETPFGHARATFLHCNKRHHTLAIGQRGPTVPKDKVFGHFMVQVNEIDAVGMAYDRAIDAGMPIFRTLGRHPNDGMFSFYTRTSGGFDIEVGSGALEVGDDWQVLHHGQMSAWGHRRGQGFDR